MDGGGRATQDAQAEGWGEGLDNENGFICSIYIPSSACRTTYLLPDGGHFSDSKQKIRLTKCHSRQIPVAIEIPGQKAPG